MPATLCPAIRTPHGTLVQRLGSLDRMMSQWHIFVMTLPGTGGSV